MYGLCDMFFLLKYEGHGEVISLNSIKEIDFRRASEKVVWPSWSSRQGLTGAS